MKTFAALLLLMLVAACASVSAPQRAALPGIELGSQKLPAAIAEHDIGFGAKIRIPTHWEFKSYPMPPESGGSNIRIHAQGITLAITGFNRSGPQKTTDQLKDLLTQAAASYLPAAKEKSVSPQAADNRMVSVVYVTLNAANPAVGLRPFPNETRPCQSVLTAIASKGDATYSMTLAVYGTDTATGMNAAAARQAILGIQ